MYHAGRWKTVEIRQLETFLAVIDSLSVTRAAEGLGLSPAAVSLQLHNLSAELRAELFVRAGKHFLPTPAAKRLAEGARGVVRQVRQIEQEFENDPATDNRPFHFATGATTLIHRLSKPLRMLRKQFPQAALQITVSSTEEMVAGLLDRRIDLALITLPFPSEKLTVLPLFEEELLLLRPSKSLVRGWHVGSMAPSELESAPFLLYSKRMNMRAIIDPFLHAAGLTPRVIMEADDTEAIKKLVEAGFGCSILPASALRGQPRYFQVFRLAGIRMVRQQALAMVRSEHPRALTQSIAQFLKSAMS
jgi:DNA-binding transcriptional LysR family regulator